MNRSPRLSVWLLCLVPLSLPAQDDGRLYNPPKLEMRGWMSDWIEKVSYPYLVEAGGMGASHILLRQARWEERHPLLPVLFFPVGSAQFPERYRFKWGSAIASGYTDTSTLTLGLEDLVGQKEGPKYYELLDIVGYRLRGSSGAVLGIEGGYSDEPSEGPEVAALRAEAVRDYLVASWGIDSTRLQFLPCRRHCDSNASWNQQEEARRVTLFCNDPRVLQEVQFPMISKSEERLNLAFVLTPRFASADIRSIELSVALGDVLLYQGTIPTSVDSTMYYLHGVVPIHWALEHATVPTEPVVAQAVVVLNDGRRFASNQSRLNFKKAPVRGVPSWSGDYIVSGESKSLISHYVLPHFGWQDTAIASYQALTLAAILHDLDSVLHARTVRTIDSTVAVAVGKLKRYFDSLYLNERRLRRSGAKGYGLAHQANPWYTLSREAIERSYRAELHLPPKAGEPLHPRLVLQTDVGFEELADWSMLFQLRARAEDRRNALSREVSRKLLDRADPPRLVILDDSSTVESLMIQWLGYDVRDREADIESEELRAYQTLDEQEPKDNRSARSMLRDRFALEEQIRPGRLRALIEAIHGSGDSLLLACAIDTLPQSAPFRIDDYLDFNLRLPEGRFANRRVTISLCYDPMPAPRHLPKRVEDPKKKRILEARKTNTSAFAGQRIDKDSSALR